MLDSTGNGYWMFDVLSLSFMQNTKPKIPHHVLGHLLHVIEFLEVLRLVFLK